MTFRRVVTAMLAWSILAATNVTAGAQDYPTRTVTLVVPFPPGGLSDIAARAFAVKLQQRLGQSVVVENRVGASGSIGAMYVARANPDGHTLLINASADVTNPHYMKLGYNALADFDPVGMILEGPPLALVVAADSPFKTPKDLMAAASATPGKISFGSSGQGTTPSIAISQLKISAKVDVLDVPYRGTTQAVLGVMAGEIQAAFVFQNTARPLAEEGKVRVIALTRDERSPVWPEIPTMIELGFPNFVHNAFVGLTAPKNTSPSIIGRLNRELVAIVNEADFAPQFASYGMLPRAKNSPAEFAEYLRRETEKYGELARLTNK